MTPTGILLGALLSLSLAGCTGLISPGAPTTAPGMGPAASPAAAEKEASRDEIPASDASSGGDASYVPPAGTPPPADSPAPAGDAATLGKIPMYVSADSTAKPHPGGVSAMPADVEGGKKKTIFDYIYTGTAEQLCAVQSEPGAETVRYRVSGIVGARLLDGTKVPVTSGCDLLTLRFNSMVSKNKVHCQDLPLTEDCRFDGTILVTHGDWPATYVFQSLGEKDCADVGDVDTRGRWSEFVYFPPPSPMPACAGLNIDEILSDKSKLKKILP
jgi:hypothetical protein